MKNESFLYYLMATAHFYASVLLGSKFFDVAIYPEFYIAPGTMEAFRNTLPIYVLNALAFGTLVYVATRPIYLVFEHGVRVALEAIDKALDKSKQE